jgi:hypothetical protein
MDANRRRVARALLALLFGLALVGPGAAGRPAAAADAAASLAAGPALGLEQGLAQEQADRSLVAPGAKRDDRQRPGPALPGLLVAAVAAASTIAATRAAVGRRGRRPAPAGARAPPPLQPASA